MGKRCSETTSYRGRRVNAPEWSDKVARIVRDAKSRHRTDVSADRWDKDGFAGSDICDVPIHESPLIVRRENVSDLTVERFIQEYEKPFIPVVIDGIPQDEQWPAVENWQLQNLKKTFKKAELKCGEDDHGKSIRMKFKYFAKYMKQQIDDSPLYIFDSSFEDRKDTAALVNDYAVPKYFPHDLFSLVGEKKRPPYRWFLVGPKRSGTGVHIDPLGTSAWNTLLSGRKRWILFPPETARRIAKGKDFVYKGEDDEAVNYFADILPRLQKAHDDHIQWMEFLQYPGETVFVPSGWWHGVFNLDDTIAVTQNFCSYANFARVWLKTRNGRKRMAVKFLNMLQASHPQLYQLALDLNERDSYVMYQKKTNKKRSRE